MASIFSKIIQRELPAYIVAEDDGNMAILDINPLAQGHVLVFPKKEVDKIYDLSSEDYTSLMLFSQQMSLLLQKAFLEKRIAMAVIGLEVPHAHIHLLPITNPGELNFTKAKNPLDSETAARVLAKIRSAGQQV
jgi:histidine triad (HIT) family protein